METGSGTDAVTNYLNWHFGGKDYEKNKSN